MYKHIFILILLSCHAVAGNMTKIKVPQTRDWPLHVGIFQGICSEFNLTNLEKLDDLEAKGTDSCKYITGKTFNPKDLKASLQAWHIGSASLSLVAFKTGGSSVKCSIDNDYKTMFILDDRNTLKCTSREAKSDPNEEEEDTEITPEAETEPASPRPAADGANADASTEEEDAPNES